MWVAVRCPSSPCYPHPLVIVQPDSRREENAVLSVLEALCINGPCHALGVFVADVAILAFAHRGMTSDEATARGVNNVHRAVFGREGRNVPLPYAWAKRRKWKFFYSWTPLASGEISISDSGPKTASLYAFFPEQY